MVDEAADVADEHVPEEPRPSRLRLRLVGLSFLMLFLELALIRWAASNNIHLAYLTNFVLLASFLGIGIGFLRVRRSPDLFPFTPLALAAMVAFVALFPVVLTNEGTLEGAFGMEPLPRWVTLTVLFVLTVAVMACIGQGVARAFVQFEALEAYRLDILGSIGGIVVFSVLAFLQLPPIVWGSIAAALLVVLLGWRLQLLGLLVVVVVLGIQSAAPDDQWSPYYKITAKHNETQIVGGIEARDTLTISANNIPHQTAYEVETLLHLQPFYAFPYRHLDAASLDRVLIVGAGNGNDVAVALAQGAKHIDAVEIDPVIQDLGERYHPSHPYQDPRVTVHIDDGRAFVEREESQYDLILFALPDSLTLFAGQGSLRLENFLFTTESMTTVRELLAPGGTFAMYNYYEPFLLDRYATTLQEIYGTAPCVEVGDALAERDQAVLTAGAGATESCDTPWAGERVEPADRQPPVPLPAEPDDPELLPRHPAADAGRLGAADPRGRRPLPQHGPLQRPGVHGGGVPPAGDQERRAVRALLRHHLVRQLARVRRCAAQRLPRHRGGSPRPAPRPSRALPAAARPAGAVLADPPGGVAVARHPCRASSRPSRWPSGRSSSPTWCSPSASGKHPRRRRRSRPTSSAPSWAA